MQSSVECRSLVALSMIFICTPTNRQTTASRITRLCSFIFRLPELVTVPFCVAVPNCGCYGGKLTNVLTPLLLSLLLRHVIKE